MTNTTRALGWGSLLAVLGAGVMHLSCASLRYSGGSTTAVAHVGMEEGRIYVRPNELTWNLGDRIEFSQEVLANELATFTSSGVVMVETDAAGSTRIPDHVELAATRELIERGADGLMITHYLVDQTGRGKATEYEVRVWGRLLHLEDIGPMDQERSDLRRLIKTLEDDRVRWYRSGGASLAPSNSASRAGRGVASSSSNKPVKAGFELGSVTGVKVDFALPSQAVDAVSIRAGASFALAYGSYPTVGLPTIAVQAEFIKGAKVHPIVGAVFLASTYDGIYPGLQAEIGMEADSKGPFEFTLGARVGAMLEGGALLTPYFSFGWVW